MKSFAAACMIFIVMLAAIIGNAAYINKTVDDFVVALQFANDGPQEESNIKLQGLKIKWEKEKNYIQASVSHHKIDTVNDLISSLLIYKEHGEKTEYERTAELLRIAFEELRLLEEVSAVNIF